MKISLNLLNTYVSHLVKYVFKRKISNESVSFLTIVKFVRVGKYKQKGALTQKGGLIST